MPKLDTVGAAAIDLARSAAEEVAGPEGVGEHLGVSAEDERIVSHRFAARHPGYRGWAWTVVLARVPRARAATVSEVVLLPDSGSLLPPNWVPWSERIAPGDLGDTDVLPYRPDDPLLDEGFEQTGGAGPVAGDDAFDDIDRALLTELGLGRPRVLNREGRAEAAHRWYRGDAGPDSPTARAADASCATCGYLVGLTGSLRAQFGVCANAWSPDDGRVVSFDHGCGAHSETGVHSAAAEPLPEPMIDQLRVDLDTEPTAAEPAAEPSAVEPVAEDLVPAEAEDLALAVAGGPEPTEPDAGPVAFDGEADESPSESR